MTAEDAIRTTWSLVKDDDAVVEIRALDCHGRSRAWAGFATGVVSGYFDDVEAFTNAALTLDAAEQASGIYVTLNPVQPDLLARAVNRLIAVRRKDATTQDDHIARRRWLLLDFDPIRVAGISATKQELQLAYDAANTARTTLARRGWDDPVVAGSGNGVHLLYPLRLGNVPESVLLLRDLLAVLAAEFATPTVAVDTSVSNASRIVKLYGTLARKGDATQRRPHRRSTILELPAYAHA